MNPVVWIAGKILQGHQKKQLKKQQKQQKVKLSEAVKQLRELYSFVNWLNKDYFKNRREKKTFWKNVVDGVNPLDETLQNIIKQYENKLKETKRSK